MKAIVTVALAVAVLTTSNSFGKDSPRANPFNETLAAAPAAELPAKAADLVGQAMARDQQAATINVVKSAVGMKPAAAPAIVSAIARKVPTMAAVAAGAAAAEQPKQASAIAKAAAAAAPSQAGKIVAAVCHSVPNEYRNVAVAVSQVVPNARQEILRAVASSLPDLKPSIDLILANYAGNIPSVSATLDQAASTSTTATALTSAGAYAPPGVRGPAVAPPYTTLTTTPANVTPGTSGQVPPGGRNYATP